MPGSLEDDKLLKPGEVCKRLRVNPRTLITWATNGKFPAGKRTDGGHRLYWQSDVEAFEKGETPPSVIRLRGR